MNKKYKLPRKRKKVYIKKDWTGYYISASLSSDEYKRKVNYKFPKVYDFNLKTGVISNIKSYW